MSFLDNSGDIILDAVLTDVGRRKMANGSFQINKFALGDDEIDYSLYNKNHPSGSAYYDLEILQTPIFEATTQTHAGINYGLLATTATNLLYMPTFHVNALPAMQSYGAITGSSGMYHVVDTSNDTTGLLISKQLIAAGIQYMGDTVPSKFVLMESGLATGWDAVPAGTKANRDSYLVANNLVDAGVYVFYDNRFFEGIASISSLGAAFSAQGITTNFVLTIPGFSMHSSLAVASGLDHYSATSVSTIPNMVEFSASPNTEQSYSVISGPRASAFGIAPRIKADLSAEYARYGTLNYTVGGALSRYIDTTIYLQGQHSPGTLQIPIRIIRRG